MAKHEITPHVRRPVSTALRVDGQVTECLPVFDPNSHTEDNQVKEDGAPVAGDVAQATVDHVLPAVRCVCAAQLSVINATIRALKRFSTQLVGCD